LLSLALLGAALGFVSQPALPQTDPATGADVIRLMQQRGAKGWFGSVTFVQRTIQADGTVATWYEALRIPGQLRIDIAPVSSGNVMLFRSDSIYRYIGGELKLSRPLVHPLLLLGFDVYGQPAERTTAALEKLGYDLSKVHAAEWQGRKVWVVGAAQGDTTSKQFWVDQERYVALGKGWIETEVLFLEDGKVTLTEEYTRLVADPTLEPALFEAGAYRAPGWVTE